MINKIDILTERISNIQFHIDHVNHVIENTGAYNAPSNKTEVNLVQYLQDLTSEKQALEAEREALTNQG